MEIQVFDKNQNTKENCVMVKYIVVSKEDMELLMQGRLEMLKVVQMNVWYLI